MSKSIIVEGISKYFSIKHEKSRFENEGSAPSKFNLFAKRNCKEKSEEKFWALKDINFSINQGERLAIVGRNGAGKSTLLKILSRVMTPSSGRIEIHGRLSSLLEVGTGFHPDLTGRENIFLNGTILGMNRLEVKQKFDAIVDFAGVENFLDTPVKRYSSGMYVRLAFAVSAFLEPDIVILDEVLSVGDASFQKKSLRKLREITAEGRTVLLVSHSMSAVRDFCNKALLIENGQSSGVIDVENAIKSYESEDGNGKSELCAHWVETNFSTYAENDFARLISVDLQNSSGEDISAEFSYIDDVWLNMAVSIEHPSEELTVGFALYDDSDSLIFWSFHVDIEKLRQRLQKKGVNNFKVKLPIDFLNNSTYRIKPLIGIYNQRWIVSPDDGRGEIRFSINGKISDSIFWQLKRPGLLAPRLQWIL